jgi:uncharacterized Ntn-hydrolase superfamily protein
MTFSIVATNADRTQFGIAVASKFLAVGAAVPAARIGAGAVATQAWANTAYKADGIALLGNGANAQQTVDTLTGNDAQRDGRQLGVVDAQGRAAAYTGKDGASWAGVENLEERLVAGRMDPVVLEHLRRVNNVAQ